MEKAKYESNEVDGVKTVKVTILNCDNEAVRSVDFLVGGQYDTVEKLEAEIVSTFQGCAGMASYSNILRTLETKITQVLKLG